MTTLANAILFFTSADTLAAGTVLYDVNSVAGSDTVLVEEAFKNVEALSEAEQARAKMLAGQWNLGRWTTAGDAQLFGSFPAAMAVALATLKKSGVANGNFVGMKSVTTLPGEGGRWNPKKGTICAAAEIKSGVAVGILQSILAMHTAIEAANFLATFPLNSSSLNILCDLEEVIAQIDQDAAHEFQVRRLRFAQRLSKDSEDKRRTQVDLANVLRELTNTWPQIQRCLERKVFSSQKTSQQTVPPPTPNIRAGMEQIKKIVQNFSPNKTMESEEAQYLENLLAEAHAYGILGTVLKIVKLARLRKQVTVVDENYHPACRPREVKDVLALILTCLQLEDYKRLLEKLTEQGISLKSLFAHNPLLKYPLEARQRILEGKLDVALAPAKKGAVAYYAKQLGTIFFPQLPDLSTRYELQGEKKGHPPAAVIIHEASHDSQGREGTELEVVKETEAIFIELFYLVLRKGREGNQKDIEMITAQDDRSREHWVEQIRNIYGEAVANIYGNMGREPYAAGLAAASAFLDYLESPSDAFREKYESLFLEFRKTYTEFIVAQKFLNALEKGLEFFRQFQKGGAHSVGFANVPKLEIKNNRLLANPMGGPSPLGLKDALDILLNQNVPVLSRLGGASSDWLVEGRMVMTIERYFFLYAGVALISSDAGRASYATTILQEMLFPLIKFLVEREYHDYSIN